MHFDPTVSIGNALTIVFLLFATSTWWKAQRSADKAKEIYQRDMDWRVSNLEIWRKEHQIDSDARDRLLTTMSDILKHVRWQTEFMWDRQIGQKPPPPPKD
jgi:hypothetical protein